MSYRLFSTTKKAVIAILLACTLAGFRGNTQSTQTAITDDFKPSILNQPGEKYPQVNSRGYARFKIMAPGADSVKVSLGAHEFLTWRRNLYQHAPLLFKK